MKNPKVFLALRILLGLLFTVFGLNGFLMVTTGSGFIPMPPPNPEVMEAMSGYFKIGYLMPLVKGLQVIAGLLLLSGKFVNLALTVLGPIIVNILCAHIFIDPAGLPMALIISVIWGTLIAIRWDNFKVLLRA